MEEEGDVERVDCGGTQQLVKSTYILWELRCFWWLWGGIGVDVGGRGEPPVLIIWIKLLFYIQFFMTFFFNFLRTWLLWGGTSVDVGGREAPVFRFRRKPISVTHLVIQFTRFKIIFSFYLVSSSSFSITRKPMSHAPYHLFQMFQNYIIANLSKWEKNEKLKLAPHLAILFTSLKIAVWKTILSFNILSNHQNVYQAVNVVTKHLKTRTWVEQEESSGRQLTLHLDLIHTFQNWPGLTSKLKTLKIDLDQRLNSKFSNLTQNWCVECFLIHLTQI